MALLGGGLLAMLVLFFVWIYLSFFSRRVTIVVERKETLPPPQGKQLVYSGGVMIGLPAVDQYVLYANQHIYPVDLSTYKQVEPGMQITLRQSRAIWRLVPPAK